MEQYLTVNEVAERIKMAPGTIRNLVWRGEFKEGIHYVKPTSRKVLFIWSAIETWLHRDHLGPSDAAQENADCLIII
jgi:Helix-turn-helix domain